MSSSKYESFNARNLTPEEVAGTFIPNRDYHDLWRNDHTVVLGPRGSGKTTLFKMLTVQALHSWDNPFALELKENRPFTAIYVPTDMHWHHQLKHGEERVARIAGLKEAISKCAVTTSILLAAVKTFHARVRLEAQGNEDAEVAVAKELIREWRLDKILPTFEMIALGLKARIGHIRAMVNAFAWQPIDPNLVTTLPEYYHLDYFAAADYGCSVFDSVFKLTQSNKWAFCFDEMELAPEWLQTETLNQVRSSDQGYLIKISTSPIPSVAGETGAQPKQDYHLISIWNHSGRDSQEFAQQLAASVLSRRMGPNVTPESILGKSKIVPEDESDVAKYEHGSSEWKLFKDLAEWDGSFREILLGNGLDPEDPVTDDIGKRDSVLRKAKPIALFRSAFLKKTRSGKLWLRSRKVAGVYCGKDAVFRISDGNPRRLIGIINDLAAKIRFQPTGEPQPLSDNEQDEVLRKASAQFLGYVNALPGGVANVGEEKLDLATILKAIAAFFRMGILGEEFPLDPKGSFIVDANLNGQIVELIRLGVYHGAIVHVDPLPDTIETSVIGKRFRLSYMLAPISRLPLTLYSEISLTRILKASKRLRVRRAVTAFEQVHLPI